MTLPVALSIPDVAFESEIGRGVHSTVYRAHRDGRTVAIKVYRGARADPAVLPRFRAEAAALARLRHPSLPAVLEAGESNGWPYLVMECVEGVSLRARLEEGALGEAEAARIGCDLARALAEVHRHRLVHRDVKPENILIGSEGVAKLIDFGFATRCAAGADGGVYGTFLYSAPEQTGMLRRPVDGRADLYSIGVVLFECVAGLPPFHGSDVGELLHQHAAVPAPSLRARGVSVSPAFDAVVAKLLAKDPTDRYQTGGGLFADLERLDEINASSSAGTSWRLGSKDDPEETSGDAPLIGRREELRRLQSAWDRAVQGRGSFVLVEGEAGSGKTRLLRELVAPLHRSKTTVLSGKCRAQDALPFRPLRDALDAHLRRMSQWADGGGQVDEWREAAGELSPVLKRFSPGLACLLADAPLPPDLTGVQDLVYETVVGFVLRLASRQPLLLVIDDAQWIDDSASQVLERLAARSAEARLLVICTTRSDSESRKRLGLVLPTMLERATRIGLESLTDDQATELIHAQLGCSRNVEPDVVRRIASLANGSPFGIEEYVQALLDAGFLRPAWDRWQLDDSRAGAVALPSDILALVLTRLDTLGSSAREILQAAAVIGSRFSLDLLARVSQAAAADFHSAIGEATRARLIERTGGDYGFVHDRVQEALLADLSADARRALHQRVAEALDAGGGQGAEHVYCLARHYARGVTERTPARVYETNLAAGCEAAAQYANEEAYAFLTSAADAASQAGIVPPSTFEETLADVCVRTGRIEEGVATLERLLAHARTGLERAQLRAKLAHLHLLGGTMDGPRGWHEVQKAFSDLGLKTPETGPRAVLRAIGDWLLAPLALRSRPVARPAAEDAELRKTLFRLYLLAGQSALFQLRPALMIQMALRALRTASQIGPSRELANACAAHAILLSLLKRPTAARRYAARALQIAEQIGDRRALAQSLFYRASALGFAGDAREAERAMRHCMEAHGPWLDAGEHLAGCSDLAYNLIWRGYAREAIDALEWGLRRTRVSSHTRSLPEAHPTRFGSAAMLLVLGRFEEGRAWLEQHRQAVEQNAQERFLRARLCAALLLFHLERGDLGSGVEEVIAEYERIGLGPSTAPLWTRSFYLYKAQIRLTQCASAEGPERARRMSQLTRALRQLKRAATVPVLRCQYLALAGAHERLRGRYDAALARLAAAEQLALQSDNLFALFEVARQRAHVAAARGCEEARARYASLAHSLAEQHGWVNRARWIRTELELRAASSVRAASSEAVLADGDNLKLRRYMDALLQVSLAAASARDPQSLARGALDEIVRILGAERAFLFLVEESGELVFGAGRDSSQQELALPANLSRTVVERAARGLTPIVVSGTEEGLVLGADSIVAHDLRSVLAVPLRVEERLIGVVYVDNRLASGVFTPEDAEILLAVGNHIAIALAGARTVAQRDAAEQRVHESEERFRQLMEQAADALYVIQENGGRITEANEQACDSLGYSRQELLQRTVYDLDPDLDESEVDDLLAEMDQKGHLALERSLRRKDGSVFPIEVRISRIEASGERQYLVAARDITDRRRAERALRTSEENFRSVFENLVDIFYRTDLQGTIEMLSPSVERYGYRVAELIGRPVTDFYLDPTERDRLLRVLMLEGAVSDFEITMKRGDGTAALVSASARLLFDEAGRPNGMEGVLRDITERKRAEEQLEQSRTQLRALSNRVLAIQEEERQRIAREVHDELGQALTALSLDVSWLASHVEGDAAGQEKIAKIADQLDQTMGSVQRIARELRPLLLDDLGLVPALQWLTREFQERTRISCLLTVRGRGLTLDRERATTVFRLVQEALTNVARHAAADRVTIGLRRQKEQILLTVEDNGRGIRPEEIHHRDSLGLLGMRERVRIWDGTMQIEGAPGRGTRLDITLPAPRRRRTNGARS